ncbi:MAG: glycoside hydrolase domain-containing protein [Planctomycetota bacterium]
MMFWNQAKVAAVVVAVVGAGAGGGLVAQRVAAAGEMAKPAAAEAGTVVLGAGSYWRTHATLQPRTVLGESVKEAKPGGPSAGQMEGFARTSPPPAGWMQTDFDDSDWFRAANPMRGGQYGHSMGFHDLGVALFAARSRFEVKDPATIQNLTLAMTYAGGVVIYLNGQEVVRANLADGKIDPLAPAEIYPKEAYVDAQGKLIENKSPDKAALARRLRRLGPVELPVKLLRKGVNVLAVENHRSIFQPEAMLWAKVNALSASFAVWPHVGVTELYLKADGVGIVPNVERPAGVQIWNQDIHSVFSVTEYGDPCEPLRPVRLVVARNGVCSGQVVVGSTSAITGLKAAASDLVQRGGAGKIPASRIAIRYGSTTTLGIRASHDGLSDTGWTPVPAFAVLDEEPPAKVDPQVLGTYVEGRARLGLPAKMTPAALVPVWVTVRVPKDAAPGLYEGALTLSADVLPAVKVPVNLDVIGWTLPGPGDFRTFVSLYQSPESLAVHYNIPLWSEEHWKLLEGAFKLMGELGNRFVCVPLVNHTQFGNDACMIPWIKQPDDSYKHDFTVYDRYVGLAAKHCALKVISYQVYLSEGWKTPGPEKPTFVTVVDKPGGKGEVLKLPAYNTAECRNLLTPLLNEIREHNTKMGLGKDVMLVWGISQDTGVHKDVVAFFKELAPDMGWHYGAHNWSRKTLTNFALAEVLLQLDIDPPEKGRRYGWKCPMLMLASQRKHEGVRPPLAVRAIAEHALLSGNRGLGRYGLDYWPVKGGVKSFCGEINLFGRWPESAVEARALWLPYLAMPGPKGPLPWLKTEVLREGIQEAEARIFLEEALVDKTISGEPAERCQKILDQRSEFCRLAFQDWLGGTIPFPFTCDQGWRKSSADLYRLAAEVAKNLSGK